jgi:hypothetical protein
MRFSRWSLTLALVILVAAVSRAQVGSVSLTALDVAYTQDFNTLAITGPASTVPAGWGFAESGVNANTTYSAGAGASNTGDTYSFGVCAAAT